jgi:16S rRNA (cytosine1402-N4)-methyltransferase
MRSSPAGEMEHPFRPLPSSSIGETSRRRLPTGELRMSGEFEHRPVMLDEIVDVFRPVPEGLVVDATLGGGGHARDLLSALPHIRLLGLDRDEQALAAAGRTLAPFEGRWAARHARFDELRELVADRGLQEIADGPVVGVLFDLGVSSPQIDQPERGFSYNADGPLDMRMDRSRGRTAGDVVNTYPERELARVLFEYGDERHSRRVAAAIVAARPIVTTGELVEVIRSALPPAARRRRGHPAKRSFQALRIEVNGELAVLPSAVDSAIDVLVPSGRCAVISYHSGEDRIVKERFADAVAGGCTCPPQLPCVCGATPRVRLVWRGAHTASDAEVAANPRSSSARLRVVEKLPWADHPSYTAEENVTDADPSGGDAA